MTHRPGSYRAALPLGIIGIILNTVLLLVVGLLLYFYIINSQIHSIEQYAKDVKGWEYYVTMKYNKKSP